MFSKQSRIRTAATSFAAIANIALATMVAGQVSVSVHTQPGDDVIDVRVTNVVMPQASHGHGIIWRPPTAGAQPIVVSAVAGDIDINDGIGTTNVKMTLRNPGSVQQEAQLLVPVPAGAAIRTFGFDGGGMEPTAKILPKEEARRIYEAIVRKAQDPALLEFVGYSLVKSSVFPVPPGGTQTISLTYEQVLPRDGERVDLAVPRTGSLESSGTLWTMKGRVRSAKPITTLYSPSHELRTNRISDKEISFEVPQQAMAEPGVFRISCLMDKSGAGDGLNTTVMAYPDPQNADGGGYFLLLGGVPPPRHINESDAIVAPQKREVVIVIDRSGSMRGEKIEQARAAAVQVIDGLHDGEAFNVIDFSSSVERFSTKPVIKDGKTAADAKKYVRDIQADGGTNLHDALMEALRPDVAEGMLPMVLFLTDGMPTVGVTSEAQIREASARANTHKRRVFTFGVGLDVNAPLLDHLADANRGASINVLPKENVEVAVSRVFKRLMGPVMNSPALTVRLGAGGDGPESTRSVRDVMPPALPDLFEGDQLVVLGRYTKAEKMRMRIEGEFRGRKQSFDVDFDPATATTRNSFVPRLWASRRIGYLTDEIRQTAGGSSGQQEPSKELVKEIVELSTRWGILTEYTSFLATEPGQPVPLSSAAASIAPNVQLKLQDRAVAGKRDGAGSVNQSMNAKESKSQLAAKPSNAYYDENLVRKYVTGCQQAGDQTLFARGNRWIDARILQQQMAGKDDKPDQTIIFGSADHFALACKLADEEGGNRSSLLAMSGEVFLLVDGKRVLITAPQQNLQATP